MPYIAPRPLRAKYLPMQDNTSLLHASESYEPESVVGGRPSSTLDYAALIFARRQRSSSPNQRHFVAQTSAISNNTLVSGLYAGASRLAENALAFFMVAYSHEGTDFFIRDPDLDKNYLSGLFAQVHGIHFRALSGTDATLSRIDTEFRLLWDAINENTHLFVLLTGHGVDNAMVLHDDERIDESFIAKILEDLPPKNLQITVVFDICRENLEKPAIRIDRQLNLVWSCSLGQQASALEFRSFRMPSSFFLIGFFMAAWDVCQAPGGTFEHHLQTRVMQLARFNSHIKHIELCEHCLSGAICSKAFEMKSQFIQEVDFSQAKGALTRLRLLLNSCTRFIQISQEIHAFMMANKPFRRSNSILLSNNLNPFWDIARCRY